MQGLVVEAGRVEPVDAPGRADLDGRIPVLTETGFAARWWPTPTCRLAIVGAEDFIQLIVSERPRAPQGDARDQAGREPDRSREQTRERLASLGTMPAGLAHELNNPASAARRAAADLAEALDVLASTIGAFVETGIERRRPSSSSRCSARRWSGRPPQMRSPALDAADAEDELLGRLERLGLAEPWRVTEPLAAAGVDAEWLSTGGRACRSRRRLRPLVDRRLADRARACGADLRVDRSDGQAGQGDQGVRVHGSRRARRDRHPRGPGDDADRARPQAEAHVDQGPAQLRQDAAEADAAGLRAQPGVDEPARERDRGARRFRHDHGHTERDGVCARVDIADDGPGIPDEIRSAFSTRSSRPRASARAPASASTPRAGSSPSGSTARSRSSPSPAGPYFTSGSRSTALLPRVEHKSLPRADDRPRARGRMWP